MGVHVFPRFSVFQRLPAAAATYHTLGFLGSTAMSDTRPVVRLGPMLRNSIFRSASASNEEALCNPRTAVDVAVASSIVRANASAVVIRFPIVSDRRKRAIIA